MDRPLRFGAQDGDDPSSEALCGIVRTSSWHYDGERTDLHDIWSLCWAAFLRAAGIASPWLVDEQGFANSSELYARLLIIQPASWEFNDDAAFKRARSSLSAWTAFAYHMLDGVFDWARTERRRGGSLSEDGLTPAGSWAEPVLKTLRHPKHYNLSNRTAPTWTYLSVLPRGVSIVQFPKARIEALRVLLATYRPNVVLGEKSTSGVREWNC